MNQNKGLFTDGINGRGMEIMTIEEMKKAISLLSEKLTEEENIKQIYDLVMKLADKEAVEKGKKLLQERLQER